MKFKYKHTPEVKGGTLRVVERFALIPTLVYVKRKSGFSEADRVWIWLEKRFVGQHKAHVTHGWIDDYEYIEEV